RTRSTVDAGRGPAYSGRRRSRPLGVGPTGAPGGLSAQTEARWMKKYHLLAPGPTPLPPEVLQALSRPILHHRTPEFEALFARVRAALADLCETRGEVIVLAASGTGAMEAA